MKVKNSFYALAALALLIAGCSNSSTSTVQNQSDVFMTIGDTTVDKGQIYNLIKESDGPDLLISLALTTIYDKEVPRDDAIKEEADKQYEDLLKTNESLEEQLKKAGYASREAYIDQILIPSVQSKKLTEKYFDANEDSIKADYSPSVARIIQCDTEKKAKDALAALQEGKKVEDVVKEFGSDTATYKGEEKVVTTEDATLPARLVNSLADAKAAGVISEVFENDDKTSYYVADLVSNDYKENASKYVDALSSNTDLANKVVIYYLTEYSFEVHDQYLFDQLKANNPQYLVTRPDLME